MIIAEGSKTSFCSSKFERISSNFIHNLVTRLQKVSTALLYICCAKAT